MKFITDYWQLLFGGLGTGLLVAVVGAWAKSKFEGKKADKSPTQSLSSGAHSTNNQSGRDTVIHSAKE
jgi:hypothetical protein